MYKRVVALGRRPVVTKEEERYVVPHPIFARSFHVIIVTSLLVVHIQLFVSNVPLQLNSFLVVRHHYLCVVRRFHIHNRLFA